jgi:hypothetical protein
MQAAVAGQPMQAVQLGHPEVLAVLEVAVMALIKPPTTQLLELLIQAAVAAVPVKFLLFLVLVALALSSSATLAHKKAQVVR